VNLGLILGPVVTLVSLATLAVVASNLITLRRLHSSGESVQADNRPLTSVLIPARNESECIVECIQRALDQVDVSTEVIVLDDRSDDDTYRLARSVADPRLTVLRGDPLPEGWTGKNWACHQLVQRATGELLCFVDADTRLEPHALREATDMVIGDDADLLSFLVAAEYSTFPQKVLLPMVNYALLALFPIALMHSRRFPRVALAMGPFVLVRADAYAAAGGHCTRPTEVVDDVKLCQAVKASGGRVRLADGTSMVRTLWYPDTRGIWNGFSKNAFGALDSSLVLAALTCFALVPLLTIPFLRLGLGLFSGAVAGTVLVQVALVLGGRLLTAVNSGDPVWTVLLHPVTVVFWGLTLAHSAFVAYRGGSVEWRGREVPLASRWGA
jgi:chlorobactene glucosyltransferase